MFGGVVKGKFCDPTRPILGHDFEALHDARDGLVFQGGVLPLDLFPHDDHVHVLVSGRDALVVTDPHHVGEEVQFATELLVDGSQIPVSGVVWDADVTLEADAVVADALGNVLHPRGQGLLDLTQMEAIEVDRHPGRLEHGLHGICNVNKTSTNQEWNRKERDRSD